MFDAQLLIAPSASWSIYGPWMTRGGDNATFTLDLLAEGFTGGGALEVRIWTKAAEDPGDGTEAGALGLSRGTAGRSTAEMNGNMKDLVRYKFTFDSSTSAGDWVLFRMPPPSWFDSVDV